MEHRWCDDIVGATKEGRREKLLVWGNRVVFEVERRAMIGGADSSLVLEEEERKEEGGRRRGVGWGN